MIGRILKELRKEKGLTQEQLAKEIDLSTSAIIQYENNKREPDFASLIKLSNYFKVSAQYLTGKSEYQTVTEDILNPNWSKIDEILKDKDPNILEMIHSIYHAFFELTLKIINLDNTFDSEKSIEYNMNDYIRLSVLRSIINTIDSVYFAKYLSIDNLEDNCLSELEFYKKAEKSFKEHIKSFESHLYEAFSIQCSELYNQYLAKNNPINSNGNNRWEVKE